MRAVVSAVVLTIATVSALPAASQTPPAIPGALNVSRITGGTYTVDSAHTQVAFTVNHLGFNSYYGIFGGATGSLTLDPKRPAAASVSIEVPLKALVTTSDKLNTHLSTPDFFDSAKYPTARFVSTKVVVSGTKAKIAGNLTLRGVTKPIVLDARFTGAGANPMSKVETVGFEATTVVKRSDFGMGYGIPMVTDAVDLKITAAFEKAR
jgi:polyisoprenoid-binding protein YceI